MVVKIGISKRIYIPKHLIDHNELAYVLVVYMQLEVFSLEEKGSVTADKCALAQRLIMPKA